MITEEKPALDDALLMHYGVRGMHWGQRKAKSASTKSSSAKPGMSTKKKVAIGVGVGVAVAGAAAAAFVLSRRGKASVAPLKTLATLKRDPSPNDMLSAVRGHQINHLDTRAFLAGKQATHDMTTGKWGMTQSLPAKRIEEAFGPKRKLFPAKSMIPQRAPKVPKSKQLFPTKSMLDRTRQVNNDLSDVTQNLLRDTSSRLNQRP